MKILKVKLKVRNLIAKDLFTPKYRMRVATSKMKYNRQKQKKETIYETQRI
jgi:hypothetical protein